MGSLLIRVHNASNGCPAIGMWIELHRRVKDRAELLVTATTNSDGRTDEPLVSGALLADGVYRLILHAGDYFENIGTPDARVFLGNVPIEFSILDANASHEVCVFISPRSYSVFNNQIGMR